MKLQLALDFVPSFEYLKETIQKVKDYVDIIEIGTVFIVQDGMHGLKKAKEIFPNITYLADVKIMDAGEHEAEIAFSSGADIVTVMGFTNDATILGAVKAAKRHGGKILVDLMNIKDQAKRAVDVIALGADFACVHTASDVQSRGINPYEDLDAVCSAIGCSKTAIAGGISMDSIERVKAYIPEIIIVGSAITSKDDVCSAAKELKNAII
jgi:3-hexulose-6-phosphate synthase